MQADNDFKTADKAKLFTFTLKLKIEKSGLVEPVGYATVWQLRNPRARHRRKSTLQNPILVGLLLPRHFIGTE